MPPLEKIIVRVAGETDLDPTIAKLEKIGVVDKKNADSFKATSATAKKSFGDINTATDSTTKNMGGLGKAIDQIGPAMLAAFSVAAIIEVGKKVLEVTAQFQKLEAVLTNTLGSKSKAQEALALIQQFAAETNFSVLELTNGFVKLANQGFVPTRDELRKLADLANSTGKTFDQLTEAILDAQTGQFERLKEFGIKASKQGDQVAFTFKGVKTQVDYTSEAMKNYILSLGDLEGVSGSTAAISETLGGKISNLGDAMDKTFNTIGSESNGVLSGMITLLTNFVNSLGETIAFLSSPIEYARKAAKEEYEKAINDQKEFYKNKDSFERQVEIQTIQNLVANNKNLTEAQIKLAQIKVSALALMEQEAREKELKDQQNADTTKKGLIKTLTDELKALKQQEEDALTEVEIRSIQDREKKVKTELERLQGKTGTDNAAFKKELAALENQNQAKVNLLKESFVKGEIAEKDYQEALDKITIEGLERQKAIYIKYHQDFSNITNKQLDIEVTNRKEKLKEWADDDKYYSELSVKTNQDEQNKKSEEDYQYYQNLSKLNKQEAAERKATVQATEAFVISSLTKIASQINANNQARKQAEITEIQNKEQRDLDTLDRRAAAEGLSAQQVATERRKIQEASQKKENEIKKKAAIADKNNALFQIAIGTAQAIVKALPNPYLVALAAATGAIEAAIVQSRPIPQFAKGVVGFEGKGTGTSDENHVMISRGESVITAKATSQYKEELKALNKGTFDDYIYKKYITPAIVSDSIADVRNKNMAQNIASSMIMQELDTSGITQAIKGNKKVKIENLGELAAIMQKSDHFSKYKF